MLPVPDVEGVALRGRGRTGEVHEARDGLLGRRVAVRLHDTVGEGQGALRALGQQVVPVSAHPALLTVHGIGTGADGREFEVAELLDGGDLESWRLASGPLPVLDVVRIGVALARGLAALHRAEALHLDIRPPNVLLDHRSRPVLAEAGQTAVWFASRGLRRSQVPPGQLALLPPELLEDRPVDVTADVYGLAATLHTLLTGSVPWAELATDPGALARAVLRSGLPDLRERGLDEELGAVLAAALAPDPRRRPPDAATFGARLEVVARRAVADCAMTKSARKTKAAAESSAAAQGFGFWVSRPVRVPGRRSRLPARAGPLASW